MSSEPLELHCKLVVYPADNSMGVKGKKLGNHVGRLIANSSLSRKH